MADDNSNLRNQIEKITCDTMGNTTFMDVDVVEGDKDKGWYKNKLQSFLTVKFPTRGYISLIMPTKLVDDISELMLGGIEKASNHKVRKDTLSELMNIIGGRIMSDLKPNGSSFSIGLPKTANYNDTLTNFDSLTCFFEMNDYEFAVKVIGSSLLNYFSLTEKDLN